MQGSIVCTYIFLFAFKAASGLQLGASSSHEQKAPQPTFLQSSQAKCMDGTQAGYYFEPAASGQEDNWVIHLEGGGECADAEECHSRLEDLGCLGSSAQWSSCFPDTYTAFLHLNSLEESRNPKMFGWNHVFLPYCSQDLWSGTKTEASESTFGLLFSGHLILDAVVSDLTEKHGLTKAKTVVFSGDSAGGIGVFINVDWLQGRLPSTQVVAAPIAGFYFYAYPYAGPDHKMGSTLASFKQEAWPGLVDLWGSFKPSSCAEQLNNSAACMLSAYSGPYVKAPVFVIEAMTDAVQLISHNDVPQPEIALTDSKTLQIPSTVSDYMHQWQDNQTKAIESSLKASDGYFRPACFIHTKFSADGPLIDGHSYVHAFNSWMFEQKYVKLKDTCGLVCGTSCPDGYY